MAALLQALCGALGGKNSALTSLDVVRVKLWSGIRFGGSLPRVGVVRSAAGRALATCGCAPCP